MIFWYLFIMSSAEHFCFNLSLNTVTVQASKYMTLQASEFACQSGGHVEVASGKIIVVVVVVVVVVGVLVVVFVVVVVVFVVVVVVVNTVIVAVGVFAVVTFV